MEISSNSDNIANKKISFILVDSILNIKLLILKRASIVIGSKYFFIFGTPTLFPKMLYNATKDHLYTLYLLLVIWLVAEEIYGICEFRYYLLEIWVSGNV